MPAHLDRPGRGVVPPRAHPRRFAAAGADPGCTHIHDGAAARKLCALFPSERVARVAEGCVSPGYLLLGMLSSLVFRAVRDALPGNPAALKRIVGASLFAMGVADVGVLVALLYVSQSTLVIWVPAALNASREASQLIAM